MRGEKSGQEGSLVQRLDQHGNLVLGPSRHYIPKGPIKRKPVPLPAEIEAAEDQSGAPIQGKDRKEDEAERRAKKEEGH